MKQKRFLLQSTQSVFERGALRPLIVEAHDSFVVLKLKGMQNDYAVPWTTIYRFAQAQVAERALKARKAQLGL
jgi:hypothetical protein